MNTNERDTHFANFAQALARELAEAHVFYDATGLGQLILVRRAYDLVAHTLLNVSHYSMDALSSEEQIQEIPDLPELPKEVQE